MPTIATASAVRRGFAGQAIRLTKRPIGPIHGIDDRYDPLLAIRRNNGCASGPGRATTASPVARAPSSGSWRHALQSGAHRPWPRRAPRAQPRGPAARGRDQLDAAPAQRPRRRRRPRRARPATAPPPAPRRVPARPLRRSPDQPSTSSAAGAMVRKLSAVVAAISGKHRSAQQHAGRDAERDAHRTEQAALLDQLPPDRRRRTPTARITPSCQVRSSNTVDKPIEGDDEGGAERDQPDALQQKHCIERITACRSALRWAVVSTRRPRRQHWPGCARRRRRPRRPRWRRCRSG